MGYAQLRIDAAAILANHATLQQSGLEVWPVLKANAYGIGFSSVLSVFSGTESPPTHLCLATLEEARQARASGWQREILVLGAVTVAELPLAAELGVTPWCHSRTLAEAWLQTSPARVNLNINTGMNRFGMAPEDGLAIARMCIGRNIQVSAGTHHANADLPESTVAEQQQADWQAITRQLGPATATHSCNSSATLRRLQAATDKFARCGLALYGVSTIKDHGLQPAISLQSQVAQVRSVPAGQGISYGHEFVASSDMTLGVVACGYADGIPVLGASEIPIRIGMHPTRIVGRVTMDAVIIDLSDVPPQAYDEPVILIGSTENSVMAWSAASRRSPYEILTGLGPRPQRILV